MKQLLEFKESLTKGSLYAINYMFIIFQKQMMSLKGYVKSIWCIIEYCTNFNRIVYANEDIVLLLYASSLTHARRFIQLKTTKFKVTTSNASQLADTNTMSVIEHPFHWYNCHIQNSTLHEFNHKP